MSSTARQIIFWLLIIAGALLIYKLVNPGAKNTAKIDLVQLNEKIKSGQLKELVVNQNETVAISNDTTPIEYHIQLTNEQTKNDILKLAWEVPPDSKTSRVPTVRD